MGMKIRQDHGRFKEIVRGRIKRDLRRYMSNSDMIGRQGDKQVKIPIPRIDIPRFKLGSGQGGQGVGQGDGEVGDAVGEGEGQGEGGAGEAGEQEGAKELELEVSLDEPRRDHGRGASSCPGSNPKGRRTSRRRR